MYEWKMDTLNTRTLSEKLFKKTWKTKNERGIAKDKQAEEDWENLYPAVMIINDLVRLSFNKKTIQQKSFQTTKKNIDSP